MKRYLFLLCLCACGAADPAVLSRAKSGLDAAKAAFAAFCLPPVPGAEKHCAELAKVFDAINEDDAGAK